MASFQPNAFQPNAFQEGKAQSGAANYTITANSGTYSLTGQIATILKSRIVSAANGTYSLSGQVATVLRSKLVNAANGTYSLTGQAAAISYTPPAANYTITAECGVYSVTGQSATIAYVPITTSVQGGGIGHGGKKKKVYVNRGNQILIFKDEDAAQNWIEQEQEAEKERQRAEKKPYRPRKVVKLTVKTEPESIIKLPVMERLALSYGQAENYSSMLQQSDYDAIARIYEKLRQREEEEVLAILLVA